MSKRAYDVVVFYPCSIVPEMDGAQARVGDLLDRLTDELGSVAFYSFENDPQHPWTRDRKNLFAQRWPSIDLIVEPRPKSVYYISYFKKLLLSLFPFRARQILALRVTQATREFDRLRHSASIFIVNYQKGLCELNGVDPAMCFVETHDLHFLKSAKVHHQSAFALGSLLKLRAEMGAYKVVKGLFAISPIEASFFKMMVPEIPTYFVSAWTLPKPPLDGPLTNDADFDLMFVGSAYQMNTRGLCELYETHGDWLSQYRVAVCGQVCEDPAIIALAGRYKTISLLGYVDDLGAAFRRARLALSPVSGTGVKMKILAAIRAGLPVLASPSSMEGLAPGYEGGVFEINETCCRRLLTDMAAYDAARTAALRYAMFHSLAGDTDAAIAAIRDAIEQRPIIA